MAYQIQKEFATYFSRKQIPEILTTVNISISRMQAYGFSQYKYLYALAAWEMFYGQNYENTDPDGTLKTICINDTSEDAKFEEFEARMIQMSVNTKGEDQNGR